MTITIDIHHHRDLILPIDDDIRAWLVEQGVTHIPDGQKVGLHAGRAYFTAGQPRRLAEVLPGAPVGPLPADLVERGEFFLVSTTDVPGIPDGHFGGAEPEADPGFVATAWAKLDRRLVFGVTRHLAPKCMRVDCMLPALDAWRVDKVYRADDGTTYPAGTELDLCTQHAALLTTDPDNPLDATSVERVVVGATT